MRIGSLIGAALGTVALGVLGTATNVGASTSTVVIHDVTFTEFYGSDICGPRAVYETYTIKTAVTHATEHPDGSFNFVFAGTATYHDDFVDPTLADVDSQSTTAFHMSLTPGGTETTNLQFHDFPGDVRITEHLTLTVVNGNVVVDRDVFEVTGCP